MNLRRVVLTAAAATLATAAFVPAAQAATTNVSFTVEQGSSARVELTTSLPHTRFDVIRSGSVVGSTTLSEIKLSELVVQDMVAVYNGNAIVATVLYDGLPIIGDDACITNTSFAVRRGPGAEIVAAGAYDGLNEDYDATWTPDENAVVTLTRPLGSSDVAYVETYVSDGRTSVDSTRLKRMQLCFQTGPRTPPTDTPPPSPAQPPVPPPELIPSSAEMLRTVKGSLQAAGSSLRTRTPRKLARSRTLVLPFAFPEAGRVDLELVVSNKTIATGAKTSAVNGKVFVTLQLTPAGRTLLKRSKKLKVTVKGAFTPLRNGAATSRASSTVTLKR